MIRCLVTIGSALMLGLGSAVPASAALTPTITSFPSSNPVSASSHPYAIAGGPDGALWFTDPYAHDVGRMTTDGTLTLQAPVSPTSFQYGITAGSDGAMWFVSQGPSTISRIDESGAVQSKALASPTANPTHVVTGPDAALWITESAGKIIGRIPAATPLATPDESRHTTADPNAIASGSDGNLWFTEYSASVVARMTPAGTETDFPLPTGIANPEGIAAGSDGALWYTAGNPPTIVRMATDGSQTPYALPASLSPIEIAAGPDDALWFAAFDSVGRIATDGTLQTFSLPPGTGAIDITAGLDGNVWFTEANVGKIGRITTPPNAVTGTARGIGSTRASAVGTVNGHSQATSVAIEYGPLGQPTRRRGRIHLAASASYQPVSIGLRDLTPATTYRYRVIASNGTGSAAGVFMTFTTGPLRIDHISRFKISPRAFRAASRGGAIAAARRRERGALVSYVDSMPAVTTFVVQRPEAGRRRGGKCVRPRSQNRGGRPCVRWVSLFAFKQTDFVGRNRFRFTGRVHGRQLAAGSYRLKATPRNAAGVGPSVHLKFHVTQGA